MLKRMRKRILQWYKSPHYGGISLPKYDSISHLSADNQLKFKGKASESQFGIFFAF